MIQGGLILNMNRPAITDVSKEGGTIRLQPHPDLKVLRIWVKPTTFRKINYSRLAGYVHTLKHLHSFISPIDAYNGGTITIELKTMSANRYSIKKD